MKEGLALSGSQRWLQLVVNRCPNLLGEAIAEALDLDENETIQWLSPMESDGFTEYQDQGFLKRLGISTQYRQVKDFWPRGGPVWDGLARTSEGRCLLVEAKANLPEFDTSPTGASHQSVHRIKQALDETRAFLRISSDTDWSKCFYQYANRLAHLYFLKELNKVEAALIFVYFVGDTTISERHAVSVEAWKAAICLATQHLGVRTESGWLCDNVVDIFFDVNRLRHVNWP